MHKLENICEDGCKDIIVSRINLKESVGMDGIEENLSILKIEETYLVVSLCSMPIASITEVVYSHPVVLDMPTFV